MNPVIDFLSSGRGSILVTALAGLLAATAAYVRSRTNGKQLALVKGTINHVHTMVNGNTGVLLTRVAQLEQYIRVQGLSIPPSIEPAALATASIPPPEDTGDGYTAPKGTI